MKDSRLGNAFLDVVLVGLIGISIAVVADLARGGGVNLWLLGATALIYATYFIAAIRLGASPGRYIRFVGRRGQPPL
ncbi:MAG: hypothetical protein ACLGIB_03885 [Actinomycetota bacterium]